MTISLCVCSLPLPLLFLLFAQLSSELGMNIRPKQSLTFAKCLEMGLQNHVEEISKVGEVAGKEYAIEQVSGWGAWVKLTISMVSTITDYCGSQSKCMFMPSVCDVAMPTSSIVCTRAIHAPGNIRSHIAATVLPDHPRFHSNVGP